jgi:hypothetical protein
MSKEKGQFKKKVRSKHKFLTKDNRAIFGQPNKIGITPLEMAAYFGKRWVFKRLLVKTEESVIDKKINPHSNALSGTRAPSS